MGFVNFFEPYTLFCHRPGLCAYVHPGVFIGNYKYTDPSGYQWAAFWEPIDGWPDYTRGGSIEVSANPTFPYGYTVLPWEPP